MAIDTQRVGNFALEAIEALAARYEHEEDIEIETLQLVVSFTGVPNEDGDGTTTEILSYTEDVSITMQLGLMLGGFMSLLKGAT